jgi:hypothetical protein
VLTPDTFDSIVDGTQSMLVAFKAPWVRRLPALAHALRHRPPFPLFNLYPLPTVWALQVAAAGVGGG